MKTGTAWWLMSVVALSSCYQHQARERGRVDPQGTERPHVGFAGCGSRTTVYSFDRLQIPTAGQGELEAPVGVNVDGRGDSCGVADYPGDVDNALIDLADGLASISPADPLDLRAALDRAVACSPGSSTCRPLAWGLSVTTDPGAGCTVVAFTNSVGAVVSETARGSFSGDGELRVTFDVLQLSVPYVTDHGPVDFHFHIQDAVVRGTIRDDAVRDILIGGVLDESSIRDTLLELHLLAGGVTFDDMVQVLDSVWDIQQGSRCSALSFGLVGHAR